MTVRDLRCDAEEYVSVGAAAGPWVRECPPCGRCPFTSIITVVVVVGPWGPLLGIRSTGITTPSRGFDWELLGEGMGMDGEILLGGTGTGTRQEAAMGYGVLVGCEGMGYKSVR